MILFIVESLVCIKTDSNLFAAVLVQNREFTKIEQKIPNGIELYAVKPKISWIRYICFWTDFSPWRV